MTSSCSSFVIIHLKHLA
ncbi:hypothetical protein HPS53_10145 [Prevotella sp. PTAC]|nr:hypothetical protein [Prevotella sp. PTAC]